MSGIVIYSSFFPNDEQLFRGIDFLNMMKNHFSNYRIYIGIQVDTTKKWKEIISEYKKNGLDITYEDVNPRLYVNSDVSGYQKAIELLYNDKRGIDGNFVWFGHSKGATTGVVDYHRFTLSDFWGKKNEIETRLNSNEIYGCFGNDLSYLPEYNLDEISNRILDYSDIKKNKKVIPFMFVNTFFVIKLHIFKTFLENIKLNFFNEHLIGHNNIIGDRYFFERDFIHFVDILGYIPIYNGIGPNVSWGTPNKQTIDNELELWMKN